MGYAFISYSTKNQVCADSVRELFRKNSIETWMAPGDIPAGSRYAMVINRAIKDCSCFVLLLTDDSQNSVWVSREVERAVNYRKAVITIRLEDVVLNDEFELYISTDQVVAMNKIDENSEEAQKVLAAVIAYAGQTLVTEEEAGKPAEAPVEAITEPEKEAEKSVGLELPVSTDVKTERFIEPEATAGEEKKAPDMKENTPVYSSPENFSIEKAVDSYNKYKKPELNEVKKILKMSKKQIRNALNYIADSPSVGESDIVGIFDGTIMGSGKSGVLFLRDRFIWKYIGDNLTLRYSQISSAEKEESRIIIRTVDGMSFVLSEPVGGKGIDKLLSFIGDRNREMYNTDNISSLNADAVRYVNDKKVSGYVDFRFAPAEKPDHLQKIIKGLGIRPDEHIIAVFDTTISNNGKSGIALTEQSFYWDALKGASPLKLGEVSGIDFNNDDKLLTVSYKNGEKSYIQTNSSYLNQVVDLLDYIITNRKA